jgi:hypothetical protein
MRIRALIPWRHQRNPPENLKVGDKILVDFNHSRLREGINHRGIISTSHRGPLPVQDTDTSCSIKSSPICTILVQSMKGVTDSDNTIQAHYISSGTVNIYLTSPGLGVSWRPNIELR